MSIVEPLLVEAIYSFKGKNNDELCFKKGDVIVVSQKEDGGWWEGTVNEKTGWFPSNYVQDYKPLPDAMSSPIKFSSPVKLPTELVLNMKANRALVVKDIIDSEKTFVAELQTLIHNFLVPIEKSDVLSKEQFHQLTSNLRDILNLHESLLATLEAATTEQRLGRVFLQYASDIKRVHYAYAHAHPRAACILDSFKDELTKVMESSGASSPGLLVLTTGLSKPLRRLDKYTGLLQELERHVDETHADRGDSQRCVSVYRDIQAACAMVRRQKELELEVLHMGSVAVGTSHQDRYFVLFSSTLLMLSVSSRMSAFIYEGKLPLTGIVVSRLEDCEAYKNAFQITGPLIDTILAICQTRDDLNLWIEKLTAQIRANRAPGGLSVTPSPRPVPPPHHPALKNRQSDSSSCNVELIPWSLTHLRPSPPLHASFCRNEKLKPYKSNERSYDEDAQILKVIESYCSSSSQSRHTLNSEMLDSPTRSTMSEYKILAEIDHLKADMLTVQSHVLALGSNIESERRARLLLQSSLSSHRDSCGVPDKVQ